MGDQIFNTVEEAIDAIKDGRMVIVADDEDRENEGDLVCAAEKVTPEIINFMATEAKGLICMPVSSDIAEKLKLDPMTIDNTDFKGTAFTVSIDGCQSLGFETGISAKDRANTIKLCMKEDTKPEFLRRPGHIFPLVAKEHGVLERTGQTEASVDLSKMAGLKAGAVICEILNPDGTMARRDQLAEFSKKHNIPFITVAQIIEYRLKTEKLINKEATANFPHEYGDFKIHGYKENISGKEHVVLTMGEFNSEEPVLVRIHSECLTGDALGSLRCDCRSQLLTAQKKIAEVQQGVIIYLKQEGRGIGLLNKVKAYSLQDKGLDTYEANHALGFPDDLREFWIAVHILKDLGIKKIKLMTNNPEKIETVEKYGIEVVERIPLVKICTHNKKYLEAKELKRKHMLNLHAVNIL